MRFLKSTNSIYISTIYLIHACLVSISLNAQNQNNNPKLESLKIEKVEFLKDVKYIENEIYITASFYTGGKSKDSTTIAKLNSNLDPIWSTQIGNEEPTYPLELFVIDNKTFVIAYSLTDLENPYKSQTLWLYEINKKGKTIDKKELGKSYGKQTTSTVFKKKLLISYYTSKDSINIIEIDTKSRNSFSKTNSKFKGTIKDFIIFNNKALFVYQNDRKFILNEFTDSELITKTEIPFSNGRSESYGAMKITENKTIHLYNSRNVSEILKYEINDKFEYNLIEEIKLPINTRQSEEITNLKIFNNELWCFYKGKNSQSGREYALLKFSQEGEIKKIDLSGMYIAFSFFINHDILIGGKNLFTKNLSSFKTTKFYSSGDEIDIDLEMD